MLVAWDHQGDWANRELTYLCFWRRKAQNISAFSLLSQLFSKINKKYFSMIGKTFSQTFAWLFSSKLLLFAKWTFQVKQKWPFSGLQCFFFNFETYSLMRKSLKPNTGGPRILWFLVPKSNHEMWGSCIPRTVLSVKAQNF